MSGPAFLLVYGLFALAVNIWFRHRLRVREAAIPARFMDIAQDPYQVAYLRNGAQAAIHLTVFSLVDRGLLAETGTTVRRARSDALSFARRPIEKDVLSCCTDWTEVKAVENNPAVGAACQAYRTALAEQHLLADARVFSQRFLLFTGTIAALAGVALARIFWALTHGRHNIGLLIVLALVGGIALAIGWRRRRTGLGDAAIDRLTGLFANLKRRAGTLKSGGRSHDAVLTAALFGMAALPPGSFPYLQRLFPKPKSSDDGGSGDGGSSDGGGGCGGGGCGGGCGG